MGKMVRLKNPVTGECIHAHKGDNKGKKYGFKRGFPKWVVIGEWDGMPPEHAEFIEGQGWVVDEVAAAEAARIAAAHSMTRDELVADYETKIASLEERLAALEAMIATITSK